MNRSITGFHLDEEYHWVAELDCGHNQHVRHDPPWTSRPWVISAPARAQKIGAQINCKECDAVAPPDRK